MSAALWLFAAGGIAALASWAQRNVEVLVPLQPADDRQRRLRAARRAARGCYVVALLFAGAGIVSVIWITV